MQAHQVEPVIHSRVRLFEAEPELLRGVEPRAAQRLARITTVEAVDLELGEALPDGVHERAVAGVMVLDEEFLEAMLQHSSVFAALLRRVSARADRLSKRLAIVAIRQLDDRLLVLLRHLADEWGVEERDAVRIPLRLSHELLAEMAGAQRPSVSSAVARLRARGLVERGPRGSWILLAPTPARALQPDDQRRGLHVAALTVP